MTYHFLRDCAPCQDIQCALDFEEGKDQLLHQITTYNKFVYVAPL